MGRDLKSRPINKPGVDIRIPTQVYLPCCRYFFLPTGALIIGGRT